MKAKNNWLIKGAIIILITVQEIIAVQVINFEQTNSGTILFPGQEFRYVFNGTQGQRVYFDSLKIDTAMISAKLIAPNMSVLFETSLMQEITPIYLPQDGSYTLVIRGTADTTGDFAFRLIDAGLQRAVNPGETNAITLSPSCLTQVRTFNGTAGQRIALESLSFSGTDAEWMLVDPANHIVAQNRVDSDLDVTLLRVTGKYLIIVRGTAQDGPPLNFQFRTRDVSDTPVSASGFNIVRSGTIGQNKTNTYTFIAPAGTPAYYDALVEENSSDIGMQIVSPNGEIIIDRNGWYNNATLDYGPFILPRSGTYTLRIIGNSGGYFRCRLLNLWTNSIPVALGATNTGVFGETNATVIYKVEALPGQKFYYDSLVVWRNVELKLWRATRYDGQFDYSGYSDSGDFLFSADSPEAIFYIFKCNTLQSTTSYKFRILRLDQPPVVEVSVNTAVSNILTVPRLSQVYRFNTAPGQRLFIDFVSGGGGWWTLYGPDGEAALQTFIGSDGSIDNTCAGTYGIVIAPSDSDEQPNISYSFRIVPVTSVTNTLEFSVVYSNILTAVGQEHRYVFAGTIGMRLYYDALLNTDSQIPVELIAPNGTVIWYESDADDESNPITLNQNGNYTLIFGGKTDATGPYSFRLINVDQPMCSELTFGSIIRGTNNPYYASVFRVPIMAGKQLFCDSRLDSYCGWWGLFDVDDTQVAANNLAYDFEPTPGKTGTGLLVVGNDSGEPCQYEFRVLAPTRITNEISIGTTVSNQFADAGDEHYLIFNATAGQRLYFDALETQSYALYYQLVSPNGRDLIWNSYWNFWNIPDSGLSTIPISGTYTLWLHNRSGGPANYRFRILDLAAQPVLPLSSIQSGRLDPLTQTHIYQIRAAAGQKIRFNSIETSSSYGYWFIQDIYNNQINSANIQDNLGEILFPVAGTYALIIAGYSYGSGPLDYQILATDVSDTTVSASGFGTYTGYVAPNQTNYVFFNASAGTPIYIDSLTNNFSVTLRLRDTNGVVVLETKPGYGSAGAPDPGFCILPSGGTYTLEIEAYNGGDYAFRILNLFEDAHKVELGREYHASFTNSFQTDVYQMVGNSGQLLYYDALMTGQDVYVCLLSPFGETVYGGLSYWNYWYSSAYSDSGVLRLPLTNTYYLVVMNASDQTPDYKFRILDFANANQFNLGTIYTNSIAPFETEVLSFTSPAASYFFDALDLSNLRWEHIPPGSEQATAGGGDWDFESSSPVAGTNFVLIQNDTDSTRTYAFRVLAPISITNSLSFGSTYSNIISPGQEHWYTFTGVAGQWIYFDSLLEYDGWIPSFNVTIFDPTGYQIWIGNYWDDTIPPLRLVRSGLYMVRLYNYADYDWSYAFRILDVADQPVISMDAFYSDTVTPGTKAQLFRFTPGPSMKVFFDNMSNFSSYCYIYDPANSQLGGSWVYDFQVSTTLDGEHLLILYNVNTNDYTYAFRLVPGNHAPSFTSPTSATVAEQTTLSFTNVVSDPEIPNDQVTFSLAGDVPSGLTINPSTGVITWTPDENQGPSTNTFTIVATDDGIPPLSSSTPFTVVVQEVNQPPVLTMPANQIINELTTMAVYASAYDPDLPTNTLTFTIVSAPSGVNINPNTGLITWTPGEAQGPSTNSITVKVTDNNPWAINEKQFSATNSFVVIVNEVNSAPVLPVQTNREINELTTLIVTNTAIDPDLPANLLSYQLVNPPEGVVISDDGIITWTPTEQQGPGVYTITTVVTDNGTPVLSATNSFTVIVNEVNSPPVLSLPKNQTVHAGTFLTLKAEATDPDIPENAFSFALVSGPSGVHVSNEGRITWQTTDAQAGTTNTITVRVTDNGVPPLSNTNSFVITVLDRPTITLVTLSNELISITWTSIPETVYRLQYKTKLTDSVWSDVSGDVTASGYTASKTDNTGGTSKRFYRVIVP